MKFSICNIGADQLLGRLLNVWANPMDEKAIVHLLPYGERYNAGIFSINDQYGANMVSRVVRDGEPCRIVFWGSGSSDDGSTRVWIEFWFRRYSEWVGLHFEDAKNFDLGMVGKIARSLEKTELLLSLAESGSLRQHVACGQ